MKIRALVYSLALFLVLAITAFAATTATVVLSWTASTTTSPAVTYQVFRETRPGACTSTTSGAGPTCLLLNQTGITATTYTDTNVPTTETLYYVVRAVNANGKSGYTNEVKVTFTVPPVPAAPTGLVCSGSATDLIVACQ